MNTEALKKAVSICGGQSALARAIGRGVKQQNISYWLKHSYVPPEFCRDIEAATDRQVTRYELSPQVFGPAPEKHTAA
ncbi:MAG: YdaS family helix-turn-helix protein [Salinisphaera sp.]|jgi:DNA-binding transcriptional regulator YdaS (Cro superfamily)|nr:YdaS family helix-turn-helix protein [Salinisphaera sp.]